MSAEARWFERRERGSLLGMRITAWVYRWAGRPIARLLLYPIVTYFYLTDRAARTASLDYLRRVRKSDVVGGQAPGQRDVFRHFLEFGGSILDRVGFWLGPREEFDLTIHGREFLDEVAEDGRGALVLGSHLGSFDAMRLVASLRSPVCVHVLMHTENAPRINATLGQLEGGRSEAMKVRILQVEPGSFAHVLEIRRCIGRGDVVAVLADRPHPNEADRTVEVDFLGSPAALPQGPMLLASTLRCPVLLMVALRTGPRCYTIHAEKLADRVSIPRDQRPEALQRYCQRYADRLAHYCQVAPLQWFNFYDFWQTGGDGDAT